MPMTVLQLALAVCGVLWLLNLFCQYRMFDLVYILLCLAKFRQRVPIKVVDTDPMSEESAKSP